MSKMRGESSSKGTSSNEGSSLNVPIVPERPKRVAAFRGFPKGCGQHAVLDTAKSSNIPSAVADCGESNLVVGVEGSTLAGGEPIKSSVRPLGFGNSSAKGTSSGEGLSLNVPIVPERPKRVAAFREFPKGCGRYAVLNTAKPSNIPSAVADCGESNLIVGVKGSTLAGGEPMKSSVRPLGFGKSALNSDSTESLGAQKILVSEITSPEKDLNEPLNSTRTSEPAVRETIHQLYPSQRRASVRDFHPRYGRFHPRTNGTEGQNLAASSTSRSVGDRFEETMKGYSRRMEGKVHKDSTHALEKKGRGYEHESPTYRGRDRAIPMVSRLEAKRPTTTQCRFATAKGKEKMHDIDMHDYPSDLMKKKDRGDKYESHAYGEQGRAISMVSRLRSERPSSSTSARIHAFVDEDVVARSKVKEALRLFQTICRILLRDLEARPKKERGSMRVDELASCILKKNNKYVNPGKPILGLVPGVRIGDEFRYRFELIIVGLHRAPKDAIDRLMEGGLILATSVIASEEHDEMDSPDVIIYSGQRGKPDRGKKQAEDQKFERGNLALKNSWDKEKPIRVIRGFKEKTISSKIVSRYIYDGLYLVEGCWKEQGCHGTIVLKFQLRRQPGQPELDFKVQKSRPSRVQHIGLCSNDISEGGEQIAIRAVNTIDKTKPPSIRYMKEMIFPSRYRPSPPKGCQCEDGCLDSRKCSCAIKNGGKVPFNFNGEIVCVKPLVYECGPLCKCPPSCHNRVSQHGIKLQLEIFKTESRGWGVRSLDYISSGSFICEYTGKLVDGNEAEERTGKDEYLFDIGNNYSDGSLWNELSNLVPPELQARVHCETVEDVGFTIDALKCGNVGRFINHSCSPNLYVQNVLYDHHDKRFPHMMLFATENIPPLQELTFHYNYKQDQVCDSGGNIKKKDCYCGSHNCSGRLY